MRPRKRSLILLGFFIALAGCRNSSEQAARAAAQGWLPAVDQGQYAQSWTVGAPYLQRAVPQAAWNASLTNMRAPLGKVLSRTTTSARSATCALADPCVIIETSASFEHRPSATETITVMPGKDGQWRVAGYYIQ